MKVIIKGGESLSVGYLPNLIEKRNIRSTFIVKAAYKLTKGVVGDRYSDEPDLLTGELEYAKERGVGVYYDSDFAPYKANADVMLVGTARVPTGNPATSFSTSMTVGGLHKQLTIYGVRRWIHTADDQYRASEPEAASSTPVHYGNSFGGTESAFNPIGKGYFKAVSELSSAQQLLPQIENTDRQVRSPEDTVQAAGFGPVSYTWPSRSRKLGSYDEQWLADQWPWFPKDQDWSFFNAAPADQQVKGFLRGDESVQLVNLVEDFADFKTKLPARRMKVFLDEKTPDGRQSFRQIKMNLDTLWIDADEMKVVLTWRGVGKVTTPKLKEVDHIYVVSEPMSTQERSLRDYSGDLFSILRERETEGDAEMDAAVAALDADDNMDMEAFEKEFIKMDEEFDLLVEESEKPMTHADFPELDKSIPLNTLDDSIPVSAGMGGESADSLKSLQMDNNAAAEIAKVNDEASREIALMDVEFAAMDTVDNPDMDRDTMIDCVARRDDLSGFEFDRLDLSDIDFSGLTMIGTQFHSCKMDSCIFSNADLQDAEFNGSSMMNVTFRNTNLQSASFAKTVLTSVLFDNASLSDAEFSELTFDKTLFKNCQGRYIDFSNTVLTEAVIEACRFRSSSFDNCNMKGLDLEDCDFSESSFSGVSAVGTSFRECVLQGIKADEDSDFTEALFQNSVAIDSQWDSCTLHRASLDGARFDGARFEDCLMSHISFDGASAKNVCFDGADLRAASLNNSNLLRASFERSELTDATFLGSNLYESTFLFADIDNTNFTQANLAKALIRNRRG